MQNSVTDLIDKYMKTLSSLQIRGSDIAEVIILAFLLYQVLAWMKRTRAWSLLKGFWVILLFIFLAWFFRLNNILWLVQNAFSLGITVLIIVFQPELRRALEQLGQQNILSSMFNLDGSKENAARFSDKTVNELIKAVYEMAKVKTGALIVIEKNTPLQEYERTGITLDSLLSSQLLINIFEHNTPLHDGAVIMRGDRVVSATCYLPLSDNMFLSKDLGTRHRAAVGVSEVTDSLTIVVSEETGKVSAALDGKLMRDLTEKQLREQLVNAQNKSQDAGRFKLWKGRVKKHAENADQ